MQWNQQSDTPVRDKWGEVVRNVCYFDIDGVLADYPQCWLDFLKLHYEEIGMEPDEIDDLNKVKRRVPYQTYKDLKKLYRTSGYKGTIPVNPGAAELVHWLKSKGYIIVIITSRPIKEHPCLFKITTDWLQSKGIPYDDLIYNEDKVVDVATRYPGLHFGVEDHRYYANLVAQWGYQMFLLDNKYNQGEVHPNVTRIYELGEIKKWIRNHSLSSLKGETRRERVPYTRPTEELPIINPSQ